MAHRDLRGLAVDARGTPRAATASVVVPLSILLIRRLLHWRSRHDVRAAYGSWVE